MKLYKFISENPLAIFLKILPSQLGSSWNFSKNNARCGNSKNKNKALTEILMLTHALEKAFSLPNPRKQFGIKKAQQLNKYIYNYINKYSWDEALRTPLSVLSEYIAYHEKNNTASPEILLLKQHILELKDNLNSTPINTNPGGTLDVHRQNLQNSAKGDFKMLAENRYAIRNFDGSPVDFNLITKALDIAKKAPSACNRQAYRVHIFKGEAKDNLLKIQGGANSFYETADAVLLISADTNRYFLNESKLGYVDASLFSMALMYAFTYLGIGTIPLTLSIKPAILKRITNEFNIPDNEIPVLLIAIGNYPESFKVAMSHRNPVESFTTVH